MRKRGRGMEQSMDYAGSINLFDVKQETFRNLTAAHRFALDIGGSLAKIAYQSRRKRRLTIVCESEDEAANDEDSSGGLYDSVENEEERDCLHFVKFQTRYLEECLTFIQDNLLAGSGTRQRRVKVTGGGAHRFRAMIEEKLSMQSEKEDEMECLIRGCVFLLNNISDEVFSYNKSLDPAYCFQPPGFARGDCFPFLLVNIGSGVSILKVEDHDSYSRIGGTSLGGGTFWGIGSLLSRINDFDQLLEIAERGDHRSVDMLVGDIYGGSYETLGLHSGIIASSFGKAARLQSDLEGTATDGSRGEDRSASGQSSDERRCGGFRVEDILKSLLITVSNNIGQIAYLMAKAHNLTNIIFGGFFIRGHPTTMHTLSYAINFWSRGSMQAFFLRHEGYLGAIGAFLKGAEEDAELRTRVPLTWTENYYGSTGARPNYMRPRGLSFELLELDHVDHDRTLFAKLGTPLMYQPDTWNLTNDEESRTYWLKCFRDSMDRHACRAVESQPNSSTALVRAGKYREKFINFLQVLEENPCAYGSLTVRSILDAHENFLHEFGFSDPYLELKRKENEDALRCLTQRLAFISSLNFEERHLELIKGVLTGNIFDWGASAFRDILHEDKDFGFSKAMSKLQQRPWLIDNFDMWITRLRDRQLHRCALIFCDNSGFDIIMGIMPLALELLSRGTRVILTVNSGPSLNDVTYQEMCILLRRICHLSKAAADAVKGGRLMLRENGQSSPCLDLREIPRVLNNLVHSEGVDLIIIDGMGRALHTNLYADFSCDCLKVAVIKNAWVCRRLGGSSLFSVVCKFERNDMSS